MRWNEYDLTFRVPADVKGQKGLGTPGVYEVWASTDSMDAERIGVVGRVRGGWTYGLEGAARFAGGGSGTSRAEAAQALLMDWLRDQGLLAD